MKKITSLLLSLALLGCGASARADILELKNGTVLNGTYTGGTDTMVHFTTSAGPQVIERAFIVSLTMTAPPPPPAPPAPATPPPVAAKAQATLPVGTLLLVRMMDGVSSQNAAGASFTTKLEYDLVADGVIAVKGGTIIYGKVQSSTQAKRARGKSTLDIRLTQMVPHGSPITITTSSHREAGENSVKKVAKAAAVGAVVGNNTGSGDSGEGAAWGAAASTLKPGQTLTVAPGTLIEFQLEQPVTVPVVP